MKNLVLLIACLSILSVFSINAFGQSLYVDPDEDDLIKIKNSKYFASSLNVLRNADGELISVVKTEASRYLPNPVTDQFIDTLPVLKEGVINGEKIEMSQVSVDYNYERCITEVYQVPGYADQCNWYHRAYVTSLGINNEKGERFEIFRGLNHSYTVKPSDSVTSFWTIIRSD